MAPGARSASAACRVVIAPERPRRLQFLPLGGFIIPPAHPLAGAFIASSAGVAHLFDSPLLHPRSLPSPFHPSWPRLSSRTPSAPNDADPRDPRRAAPPNLSPASPYGDKPFSSSLLLACTRHSSIRSLQASGRPHERLVVASPARHDLFFLDRPRSEPARASPQPCVSTSGSC